LIAVVFGVFFGALLYLQSQSIITIDWTKLQSISESMLLMVNNSVNNTQLVPDTITNLGLPLTSGLSAGLVLGFTKG
ncbi:MAG: FUN14 domain-containing protein, partial [Nitrososphaeraceae archaeon]